MDKDKRYIFPNIMAEMMKKIDTRVQYESYMMSLVSILIGLIILGVYYIFFAQVSTFMKVMIGINSVAGFIFLSSQLVTTYQQYLSYMEAKDLGGLGKTLEEIKNEN